MYSCLIVRHSRSSASDSVGRLIPLVRQKKRYGRESNLKKINVMVATLMTEHHAPPVGFFVFRPPGSIHREGSSPERVLSGHCKRC